MCAIFTMNGCSSFETALLDIFETNVMGQLKEILYLKELQTTESAITYAL